MKYLLLLTTLLLISCTETLGEVDSSATERIENTSYGKIKIITVDGCEYVVYTDYNKGGITHKANCKNHN